MMRRNLVAWLLLFISTSGCSSQSRTSQELYGNKTKRSIKCIPMIKYFEVELEEDLIKSGEGLGITGDHVKLGQWNVDRSLEMKRRRRNPQKWYIKIPMCSAVRIYHRFFIYYKDSRGSKRIRQWEGQQHARVLEAYERYRKQGSPKFGEAHPMAVGGGIQMERGWLRGEYIVQMKFVWPQHIRFTSFSHFIRNLRYSIKLETFVGSEAQRFNSAAYVSDIEIEVARFPNKRTLLRPQSDGGEQYKPGQILVFHITIPMGIKCLHMLTINSREGERLGEATIAASLLEASEGILELPIYDPRAKQRVGWLTLPYVKIEPLPIAADLTLRSSFHRYWPANWPTLDMGHRGMGKSFFYHSARALENTIKSFLKAERLNSDMIELDVQLTKDYVPIVFNDCGFYTATQGSKVSAYDLYYEYINDLTYGELRQRRVFVYLNGAMVELSHLNSLDVPETEVIFPRLEDVFKHLPLSLGIMVEVKWPQLLSSGSLEYVQTLDKNRYIDVILMTSMQHGCGRALVFSSFDADICSMVRFKQHAFPVVLLTVGERSPWESYADLRTHTLISATSFVHSSEILGISIYAGELEHSVTDIDISFQHQQALFVWGDQLNNSAILDNFRELEVAGLIYDHIDDHLPQRLKRFPFFEAPEMQLIFRRQCIVAGNVSVGEGPPDTHSPFWPRVRSLDEL
ncbi:glycerophosphocholine phosphodiesterase GPCPD1 [Stomoxys calcitrans]|uniref:glycerophosphocholine phosphodiesterase GPCPD1 n=1 Tax=Stomoxys calcitrans TaxID=35570 RepID=UPI0027E31A2F|nr:glycerophosphocholine phosphodiesterase GPCPD1 [Stomoxys calcitrans]